MLPRSKCKRITIGPDQYRCLITEAMPADGDTLSLTITAQHVSANGAMLRVTVLNAKRVPVEKSKWYDGRTLERPITPKIIVNLITLAKDAGWVPEHPGPPYTMQVKNCDVFESEISA